MAPRPPAGGELLPNLLLFGRLLDGLGLDGSPARMIDLALALGELDLGRRRDVYHAMRAHVVRRRAQIPVFDEAFELFWRRPAEGATALDLAALGERRRQRRPRFDPAPLAGGRAGGEAERSAPDAPPRLVPAPTAWSAVEVLRHKDFGAMTGEELEALRRALAELAWRIGDRPSRRWLPGRGPRLDLRASLRASLRHGGEVLEWAERRRERRPRPLVVLADVSGSMERYTRVLLLFLHALVGGPERPVEVFVFGTRLSRITRELAGRDVDRALAQVARRVPDWSGGTRIGEVLRTFNFHWRRRVPGGAAVVLLISDGWDRGDPELLGREMARLQRGCHRLIWLNPLLGAPGYQPLARGMSAALPYVDDFLPAHDLASLEALARRLGTIDERRPGRRQRPARSLALGAAPPAGGAT